LTRGFLLLDEPPGALDALTRVGLRGKIEHIWSLDRKTVILISNDVAEGVLLADRLMETSPALGATLGLVTAVDIPRPGDRKALNHHPRCRGIRNGFLAFVLRQSGKKR
jgi:nitrate/nitrite transport system ATP-binding protein